MKIKPSNREYTLMGETITVYPVSAIRVAGIAQIIQKYEKDLEKMVKVYVAVIYEFTSLSEDNTMEDLEFLPFDVLTDLGSFILGLTEKVDKEKANFTKSQSSGSLTTDSEQLVLPQRR